MLTAISSGALGSGYGSVILTGLVLSWFGDAFLIGTSQHWFLLGLASFFLAHIAYAENHLVCVGVEGKSSSNTKATIGISVEEEGMPLADDAPPSAALDGKDLTFFREVLERARRYTRHALDPLTDADLQKVIVRERPDGNRREFNVGWVLYHLLEHEAGHRGQVALLRHLRRKT